MVCCANEMSFLTRLGSGRSRRIIHSMRATLYYWLNSELNLSFQNRTKNHPPFPNDPVAAYFFAERKQYKIPAWAITSTVLDSRPSLCLAACGPGRNRVGPNTIAKLCSDILFSASCWCTLWVEWGGESISQWNRLGRLSCSGCQVT